MNEIVNSAIRFNGFAEQYDKYRPVPPIDLVKLSLGFLGVDKAKNVVDLGCGTGLSTRIWEQYTDNLIGIDPSEDMLLIAKKNKINDSNIVFIKGMGNETGLESSMADVVTASSSIHWMEPISTINEVNRILRNEGVFVIYGHYFPVIVQSYFLTQAYEKWRNTLDKLEFKTYSQKAIKYPLSETIDLLKSSKLFRYSRKLYLHSSLKWNSVDYINFLNAHAGVNYLKEKKIDQFNFEMENYIEEINREFKDNFFDICFTYSVMINVK